MADLNSFARNPITPKTLSDAELMQRLGIYGKTLALFKAVQKKRTGAYAPPGRWP